MSAFILLLSVLEFVFFFFVFLSTIWIFLDFLLASFKPIQANIERSDGMILQL